jgi:hypothetical protein
MVFLFSLMIFDVKSLIVAFFIFVLVLTMTFFLCVNIQCMKVIMSNCHPWVYLRKPTYLVNISGYLTLFSRYFHFLVDLRSLHNLYFE